MPLFLPPLKFKRAGRVVWAELSYSGPFGTIQPVGLTAAQRDGMLYERRVHQYLHSLYPRNYGGGQWIKFRSGPAKPVTVMTERWAQIDGLCIDWVKSQLTIIEIKRSHSQRAWWSLRELYEPLVTHLFGPSWRIAVCEVCRWFDPAVPWPEPYRLVKEPMLLQPGEFGIHITSATR